MLKRGDSGTNIVLLQNALNRKTIISSTEKPLVADGQFGPATEARLRLFQAQNGLAPTGVAVMADLAKLNIALSVNLPSRVGPAGSVTGSNSGTTIPVAQAASPGIVEKIKGMNPMLLAGGAIALISVILFATMPSDGPALVTKMNPGKKRKHKRK